MVNIIFGFHVKTEKNVKNGMVIFLFLEYVGNYDMLFS